MKRSIRDDQYQSLAELRFRIRLFLQRSDAAAREAGVEPQQYQLLLAIRGLEPEAKCTIRALSERLLLRHHSTVELVDRLEMNNLVARSRDQEDRRQVFVQLQPKGQQVLERIVRKRLEDLSSNGRALVRAVTSLLDKDRSNGKAAHATVPGREPGGRRRLASRVAGRSVSGAKQVAARTYAP
jgi:DNA-binding MarR family transcriptional regulator